MSNTELMSVDNETTNSSTPNSNSKDMENKKKKPIKKSRKRKMNEMEVDGTGDSKYQPPGPPKKKRKKKRGWTEEEESLFREALGLYGRDWKKVSAHVDNDRAPASIRSHAQIYFLRLLQNGEKLGEKLLETGSGYTLSGKPLNKYSTVAIRHFGCADKVPMIDGVISDAENAPKRTKKTKNGSTTKKKARKKKKKNKKYYDSDSEEEYCHRITATAVADSNNIVKRRSGRKRTKIHPIEAPHVVNPFGLRTDIEVYDYVWMDDDDDDEEENGRRRLTDNHRIHAPFRIEYCPNALLLADIHAHVLRSVEIMGYLGGSYDAEKRLLIVKKCYMLNEEEQGEETVSASNVDLLNVSERIREDGLELVGWYHSHPCFDNVPSNMDCHQHSIHKYPNEEKHPYIGLIVQSLWNTHSNHSHWRWFNTKPLNGENINDHQYIALEFEAKRKKLYGVEDKQLFEQIVQLIERYNGMKYDIYRTDFGENNIEEKVLQNIRFHLEKDDLDEHIIDAFMHKIRNLFIKQRDIWWVTNKPVINTPQIDDKENKNSLN